ncbi:phosphatase PAP2 family protein [Pararhizobium mangrovi]|uniref:Phosphatase PAP2 family protein n=1 Tax=Pararhizobium mangrovi TaxID=2590452 RepID=A0A506UHR5_9HYPH|nr:phosphatase PAP2 family protein [Pararhizobium mangrovi]TPW32857.1 phosphatase PAP2 family protein [Pararhizobium mangrovi]
MTYAEIRSAAKRWLTYLPLEPRVLAGVGIVAGLILALGKIIEDVVENESGAFDRTVLLALRVPGKLGTPIGPAWLKGAVTDITALGSPTILTIVTAIAVAYLLVAGRVRLGLLVGLSVGGGAILEKLLKLGFSRARPDIVPHLVDVTTHSFPSGHATLSAVTYLTLGALLARAQVNWRLRSFVFGCGLFMTVLVGSSRVYLGVHYPTDVLAGWCFGSLWVCLFWLIARRYTR